MRRIEAEIDDRTGVLKFHGARVVLSHDGFLADFQKRIEAIKPALAHRILYENGFETSLRAVSDTEKTLLAIGRVVDRRKVVDRLLALALERGFGVFSVGSFDYSKGRGTIIVENSVVARHYGKAGSCVCFATAGIIAGAAAVVWGSDFTCSEEKCLANGDSYCAFSLAPATPKEKEAFLSKIK